MGSIESDWRKNYVRSFRWPVRFAASQKKVLLNLSGAPALTRSTAHLLRFHQHILAGNLKGTFKHSDIEIGFCHVCGPVLAWLAGRIVPVDPVAVMIDLVETVGSPTLQPKARKLDRPQPQNLVCEFMACPWHELY